jgi:chromosome partitioning protein
MAENAARSRLGRGLAALIYDHRCAGSQAYIGLAREVIARLPKPAAAA